MRIVYAEIAYFLNMIETILEKEEVCSICNGEGFITLPASVELGNIRDEETQPCLCQKQYDE